MTSSILTDKAGPADKVGLTDEARAFADAHPVARLATADAQGAPHVLPICFVILGDTLYLTIDQKPKSGGQRQLKRLRNILENHQVAVIIDHYDDDWSRLGWVMLRGSAQILEGNDEHARAQSALKSRYPQYREMELQHLPVIAIRISRVTQWGDLQSG
jgi:PPOX class probable F420-dependent enzyme